VFTAPDVVERSALLQALEAEVEEFIVRHRAARDQRGRAQVVRNGRAPVRHLVQGPARWLSARPASMTGASMPRGTGSASRVRFCRATCAGRQE
jgi:hypothetical protein